MQSCNVQATSDRPTSRAALQARLRAATTELSFRQVAEAVGCHPESARRWLTSENRPPLWFIVSLCDSLRLNPHWALTGSGAMHRDEARAQDLNTASPRLLLDRLAELLQARTPTPVIEPEPLADERSFLPRAKRRSAGGNSPARAGKQPVTHAGGRPGG